MRKYKVVARDPDGEIWWDSDEFDSREEAENELELCLDSMGAGAETMELMGEDFVDPEDIEWDIEEC